LIAITAIALTGCAHAPRYVRTDGGPVDPALVESARAQCKGEAARFVIDPTAAGIPFERQAKERDIILACMARSGY
jgi:hypothetical protein